MRAAIFKALMKLGLYPHIYFTYSPFKILEFQKIIGRVEFSGTENALDIGCGEGLHTLLIGQKVGSVTGIDVNEEFIRTACDYGRAFGGKAKTEFIAKPLEKIGFPDEHFDTIFSICVIEHIPNYQEVLSECLRILKPGGRIVFTVDTLEAIKDPDLVASHQRQHHVVQYFKRESLTELLAGIGFAEITCAPLFQSPLAKDLFIRGIEEGFNFGRFKAPSLFRKLAAAEQNLPAADPGIFLLADAIKPARAGHDS